MIRDDFTKCCWTGQYLDPINRVSSSELWNDSIMSVVRKYDLPNEILFEIFSFLPKISDNQNCCFLNICLTCKKFCEIIHSESFFSLLSIRIFDEFFINNNGKEKKKCNFLIETDYTIDGLLKKYYKWKNVFDFLRKYIKIENMEFSIKKISKEMNLSKDKKCVFQKKNDRRSYGVSAACNRIFYKGKHSWKMKIDKETMPFFGGFIGIYNPITFLECDFNDRSNYQNINYLFDHVGGLSIKDSYSLSLMGGLLFTGSSSKEYFRKASIINVKRGDVITTILDLNKGELSFRINEKNIGVAYTGITPPKSPMISFTLPNQKIIIC